MINREIQKSIFQYMLAFFCTLLLLFVLTVTAPLVPKKLIKNHMTESTEYMVEQGTAHRILNFVDASSLDYYADSVTLSIAYSLDEKHPVRSSMWSNYYGVSSNAMPKYLKESVENDLEPNTEYMRYWHGSASLMRIMHVFSNVKQVYILNYILMLCLLIILLIILWKNGLRAEALCFIISMISVSFWYVPLCLEYTYTFLIMMAGSITAVSIALKNETNLIGLLFLITGVVTVYFDFLTAETLTLLVPLLLILRVRSRQDMKSTKSEIILSLKAGACWSVGYLGMWLMKWVIAAIVLKQSMLPFITGHIAERLDGDVVSGMRPDNYVLSAIIKNVKCLFPYEFGISGAILVFVFIFVLIIPVVLNKVKMKKTVSKEVILLYMVLAFVPFFRLAVLHNHAYRHYFFTYRALAATVLAICFMTLELLETVPRKAVISDV